MNVEFYTYYTTTSFDRGYTLHEHYDEFGLINMNGRLYDPLVGRFMQTDPMAEKYYSIMYPLIETANIVN